MDAYGYYRGSVYVGKLPDGKFMEFPTEAEYIEYLREEEKDDEVTEEQLIKEGNEVGSYYDDLRQKISEV